MNVLKFPSEDCETKNLPEFPDCWNVKRKFEILMENSPRLSNVIAYTHQMGDDHFWIEFSLNSSTQSFEYKGLHNCFTQAYTDAIEDINAQLDYWKRNHRKI